MTPKLKVSQRSDRFFGERDVSARATHLKAVIGKVSLTTIERKIMSTKTTIKRLALVAAASLGLGLMSIVPAQAVGGLSVTITNGSTDSGTGNGAGSDTVGAAKINISATFENTTDTITIVAAGNGTLGESVTSASVARLIYLDTATTLGSGTGARVGTSTTAVPASSGAASDKSASTQINGRDSVTITSGTAYQLTSTSVGRVGAIFGIQLDSRSVAMPAGTYAFTVIVRQYTTGIVAPVVTYYDASVVRSAYTAENTVASAGTSTAYISTTASNSSASTDSVPNVLSTVSSTDTPRAYIYVNLLNTSSVSAPESVTVTTTVGTVGTSSVRGKSVVLKYTGAMDVNVYSDGTAGTATITIKSTSVTFANKTVVFYASAPTTIKASVINSTPGIGSTTAIAVDAKDANGNRFAGTLYSYSSATGTISNDGTTTCSYVAARDRHECSVTGVVAGTATITVRNASTVAASTVSSDPVSLTVSGSSAATVKLSWDKASYAPGEKATLLVSVLDSAGKSVPAATFGSLFATGGITLNQAAGNGSDTVTATSVTTLSLAALALGTLTDPVKAYTVYMPATGGTMTASATGGTSLPLAGQVAVSASATVADSGSQALAAVTALASQVSAFITKINAQITTLTDLVMKIQKKVKA